MTLTREIEFDVWVECNRGDDGQGWEYSVEDGPHMLLEECGLANPEPLDDQTRVEVVLTNGEVDEAIREVTEG